MEINILKDPWELGRAAGSSAVDWSKVVMFHLDEYIGLAESAPSRFRKYLRDRFLSNIPSLKAAYLINGEGDPQEECGRLRYLIERHPGDVALVGGVRTLEQMTFLFLMLIAVTGCYFFYSSMNVAGCDRDNIELKMSSVHVLFFLRYK